MSNDNTENVLYRKVDKTLYEIHVKQAENANETAEDILLRLIMEDSTSCGKEESDG